MPITLKNFNIQVLQGVGGIYHNAQLGLISLTDDGTNWVTKYSQIVAGLSYIKSDF